MNQDTKKGRKVSIILLLLMPSAHGGEVGTHDIIQFPKFAGAKVL